MARALSLRSFLGQRPTALAREQGRASRPERPRGALVWFHIGDTGNSSAITALAARFARDGDQATFLVTGANLDAGGGANALGIIFQPAPPDTQAGARDFLEYWQPDLLFWMSETLLPVLLGDCAARGCGMVLLNAGQSSALGWAGPWKRIGARAVLEAFTSVMAINEAAATSLRRVGYRPEAIQITGPFEEENIALACNEAERSDMVQLLGGRPVWFASDLHLNELATIAQAHHRASKRGHRLMLVIAPHAVTDTARMAQTLRDQGFQTGVRSIGDDPTDDTQVYIADIGDERGLWYRLAPITFMGGTLSGSASHSPFESAALGSVVVHGPATVRHGPAYEKLTAAGACRAANTAERIGDAIGLMNTPDQMATMAQAGWSVVTDRADVTNLVLDTIRSHLDGKGR